MKDAERVGSKVYTDTADLYGICDYRVLLLSALIFSLYPSTLLMSCIFMCACLAWMWWTDESVGQLLRWEIGVSSKLIFLLLAEDFFSVDCFHSSPQLGVHRLLIQCCCKRSPLLSQTVSTFSAHCSKWLC